ncbi:LapA family protein [Gammaproteobacteria bacterium AB-CW1]|uniref:LapA family protein n=1 Tax=Natronospira elongata TaxID=3110268 RepID=A0AAP6MK68_9GAMM|nr:LapA family protein [Gammaproteobacteria bacterium AB-CW1]
MTGQQKLKAVIAAVLMALVISFVMQNRETVGVEFLIWTWEASRAVVLFTVFLVGVAAGWLARGAAIRRKRSG